MASPETELARFGSLRLTPRRIIQTYTWKQSTAPLGRIVRLDVQRVHNRTWLLLSILCGLLGWSLQLWLELELFMPVGIAAASVCALFYLLSRRTRMTVMLEDGSDLRLSVRNKHFGQASRFANLVCRVCTHWEPRENTPVLDSSHPARTANIEIEIDDDELESEEEQDGSRQKPETFELFAENPTILIGQPVDEDDEPTAESHSPHTDWLKLEEPA